MVFCRAGWERGNWFDVTEAKYELTSLLEVYFCYMVSDDGIGSKGGNVKMFAIVLLSKRNWALETVSVFGRQV